MVRTWLPDPEVAQIKKWAAASKADFDKQKGWAAAEQKEVEESYGTEGAGRQLSQEELFERAQKKAKKWLVNSLNTWGVWRAEVRRSDTGIKVDHFNTVMTHTLQHLQVGDTTFGRTGLSWIIWTTNELRKLLVVGEDLLSIEMLQPVCTCIHKMVEHGMTREILDLLEAVVCVARHLHTRNYPAREEGAARKPGGARLSESSRGALFKVCNNIACICIQTETTSRSGFGKEMVSLILIWGRI